MTAAVHDVETEQALLGACLVDQGFVSVAASNVEGGDFYDPLHARMWAVICQMDEDKKPISPVTVGHAMADDPGLMDLGRDYLVKLVMFAPSLPTNRGISEMAAGIADLAARRDGIEELVIAQEQLARRDTNILEALSPVVAVANHAADRLTVASRTLSAGGASRELMRELEGGANRVPGISTGLSQLDAIIGGLYPENLIIVAGRPGMGKSTFGTCLARAAGVAGHPVEYFSLEMSSRELAARVVCDVDFDAPHQSPLSYARLLRHAAGYGELERAALAAREMGEWPVRIHDRGGVTMAQIAAIARAAATQAEGKTGIIIVDHLHIVRPEDRYRGNRVSELTEITLQAKSLAKATKWPVVLLSQLSRAIENRAEKDRLPILSDLRESGSIEQDADVVVGMLRPAHYIMHRKPSEPGADLSEWRAEYEPVRHDLNLGVIKNRHGPTDVVNVFVNIAASAIRDQEPVRRST